MGVVAPAGTPPEIIGRINREVAKILQAADAREKLAAQGLEAATSSPAEFGTYIAAEAAKWAKVIAQAGVTAD